MGISTFQNDSQELAKSEEEKKKILFLLFPVCLYTKSTLISVCWRCVCVSLDLFQLHICVTLLLLPVVLSQHKAGVKQMNQTLHIPGKVCYLGCPVRSWHFIR